MSTSGSLVVEVSVGIQCSGENQVINLGPLDVVPNVRFLPFELLAQVFKSGLPKVEAGCMRSLLSKGHLLTTSWLHPQPGTMLKAVQRVGCKC